MASTRNSAWHTRHSKSPIVPPEGPGAFEFSPGTSGIVPRILFATVTNRSSTRLLLTFKSA
jgi:hypothetical protein